VCVCICTEKDIQTLREGGRGEEILREKGRKEEGMEREWEMLEDGFSLAVKIAGRNSTTAGSCTRLRTKTTFYSLSLISCSERGR
jgi:hypothetical protein